jgi:hypothetical protein
VAYSKILENWPGEMPENNKNLSQNKSWSLDTDSNQGPSKYKAEVLIPQT